MDSGIIQKHGGYKNLLSFQVAQLVYDITVRFCDRFVGKRSRTHDQMVQAARSGVQNIAEGSQASAISKKIEIKLTGVARASLEELLLDYQDFLRQRDLPKWDRCDVRRDELVKLRPKNLNDFLNWVESVHSARKGGPSRPSRPSGQIMGSTSSTESTWSTPKPTYKEIAANGALVLISVTTVLLDRQISSLVSTFENNGGFSERLYSARASRRNK